MISEADRALLESWLRMPSMPAGLVTRARIVLWAADGVSMTAIAERLSISRPTSALWCKRFREFGPDGLADLPRSGRPATVDREKVITATLTPPPASLGVTHWSSRLLAKRLKLDHGQVAKVWREMGIKPWREGTFKFSTDPELEAKVIDIVGLYLAPPENAVVVCVDEKSQIQALDRTQPTLPMAPNHPFERTHDYVRHGTTSLFAALNIANGKVTGQCYDRHTHVEFLSFLKKVAKAYPEVELHLVMDNYATHKKQEVRAWLAENPRITVHFTPTSASWLNMVEIWFGIIERQAIHRGTFRSVCDLTTAIRAFINGWNPRSHPFVWVKTAEDILAKIDRKKTSATRH
ncbi:IS630 family transposase [Tsukamurella sp. NPDC003166]|uniref:IS630 family transposase n=1 Tax=Tsukamurella sp. NPDC003166 TaxID=3154444 RepID=UPI0033B6BCEF